jgi:hypothetical protein
MCTGACPQGFLPPFGPALVWTRQRDLRQRVTRVTFLPELLGAGPRDSGRIPADGVVRLSLSEFTDRAGDASHG